MAWVPLVGVVVQAVVGGMAVIYDLPPAVVSGHMLISMALVAVSTWLMIRSKESDEVSVPTVDVTTRRLMALLGAAALVVVALGVVVTGAGPHSGDDRVGYRFAVDPFAMARVHSLAVWVFVAVLVALLLRVRRSGPAAARRAAWVLLAVTAAQALIGYVQLFTHRSFATKQPGEVALAIEPMTAPTNALNSGRGLRWLEPGETWTAVWGIRPEGFAADAYLASWG